MSTLRLIILLMCLSHSAYAQSAVNVDFEQVYPNTKIAAQWKTGVDNGVYEVDSTQRFRGTYSYKIFSPTNTYAKSAHVEISHTLNRHLNQALRIEVKAKWDAGQVKIPDFQLDVRLNGKDTTLKSTANPTDLGNGWKLLYVDCKLTHTQDKVFLSIRNNDKGAVWFDDIRILANKREVSYQLSEYELALQKQDIRPINIDRNGRYILPKNVVDQLLTKRIVGIGEGTHGSYEFRMMQWSITEKLLSQQQNIIIALEVSASACLQLDRYIVDGQGNLKDILQTMNTNHFKYYCTEEFVEFIEWLRKENQKRPSKVRLYGVDVQYNNYALQFTRKDEISSSLIDTIHSICLRNRYFYPNEENQNDMEHLNYALSNLLKHLKEDRNVDFRDYYVAQVLYLQLIGQKEYLRDRDSLMAENIQLLSAKFPKAQIVFLANNTHCSTDKNYGGVGIKMTGFFLRRKFGHGYVAIGTCANNGFYTAQNFAQEIKVMDNKGFFTSTEFTSKNVSTRNVLHSAPKNSVEYLCSRSNRTVALMSFHQKHSQKILMRDIGLVTRECEQFAEIDTGIYDYLLFFDKVSATKLIPY